MTTTWSAKDVVAAALAGAGAMYFWDPDLGRRRRALVRDQVDHALHALRDELDAGARGATHRIRGTAAELRRSLRNERPSDRVVAARVRAELGRHVSHPRAVDVTVDHGHVRLRGPILAAEVDAVRAAMAHVRGVAAFEDALDVHDEATGALAGRHARRGGPIRMTSATRLLLGTLAATGLAVARRRSLVGAAAIATLGAAVATLERPRMRAATS